MLTSLLMTFWPLILSDKKGSDRKWLKLEKLHQMSVMPAPCPKVPLVCKAVTVPTEYRVTIRLDTTLCDQLTARGNQGPPLAAIVGQALADYLARQPDTLTPAWRKPA
jgi:hypothetical protein